MYDYSDPVGREPCRQENRVQEDSEEATVVGITLQTLQRLMSQKKSDELLALYCFYAKTATIQKTQSIYSTTSFTAKGLGWNEDKVRRVKKRLIALKLVEDVPQEKGPSGKFGKPYLIVRYLKRTGPLDSGGPEIGYTGNGGVKCSTGNDAVEGRNHQKETHPHAQAWVEYFENRIQKRIITYYRLNVCRWDTRFLPVTVISPELRNALEMIGHWTDQRLRFEFSYAKQRIQKEKCSRTLVRLIHDAWNHTEHDKADAYFPEKEEAEGCEDF
jgi:hypothetical protein